MRLLRLMRGEERKPMRETAAMLLTKVERFKYQKQSWTVEKEEADNFLIVKGTDSREG